MDVIVLTPDKTLFEGTAERLSAPGTEGEFEILSNHAPFVSSLASGHIHITNAQRAVTEIYISSGFIEVLNNKISLLVQQVAASSEE